MNLVDIEKWVICCRFKHSEKGQFCSWGQFYSWWIGSDDSDDSNFEQLY